MHYKGKRPIYKTKFYYLKISWGIYTINDLNYRLVKVTEERTIWWKLRTLKLSYFYLDAAVLIINARRGVNYGQVGQAGNATVGIRTDRLFKKYILKYGIG